MHTLANLKGFDWQPEEALEMLRQLKFEVDSIDASLPNDVVDLLYEIDEDSSVFDKMLKEVQKQEKKEEAERKKKEAAEKKKAEAERKKKEAAEKKKAEAEKKKAEAKAKAKAKAKPKAKAKAKPKAKAKAKAKATAEKDAVEAEIISEDKEEELDTAQPEVEEEVAAAIIIEELETAAEVEGEASAVQEAEIVEEVSEKVSDETPGEEEPAEEKQAAEAEAPKVIAEIIEESEEERLADLERRDARVQSLEEEQGSGALAQAEKRNVEEQRRQARREQQIAEPQGPTLSNIQADPEVLRAVLERDAERKRRAAEPPAARVGRRGADGRRGTTPAAAQPDLISQAPVKSAPEGDRRKRARKVDRSRLREDGVRRETAAAIREFRSGTGFGGPRKRRKRKREETVITTQEPVVGGTIEVETDTTVEALAGLMQIPVNDVILAFMEENLLMSKNQSLTIEEARKVAEKFKFTVIVAIPEEEELFKEEEDDPADLVPRSPVVTVMGHVDHGKTTLLDTIRATRVVEGEAGGITQHIAAYDIELHDGNRVTFLDTPGHEAFAQMRARGAHVTDVVVLVVAANDGVKPQTIEAIDHAKAAEVPIVVAVNKCDLPAADPNRVRQELTQYELLDEEWGGSTIMRNISARMNEGVDELMEMLVLQAEMLELKANPNKRARGTIVESELSQGLGPVAWVLVQDGTLRVGDSFLAGTAYGSVRTMIDCRGVQVQEAGPSTPVVVTGFSTPAEAGEVFIVTPDERIAREVAEQRLDLERIRRGPTTRQMTLEDFQALAHDQEQRVLNMIIKADVQGSVDTLKSMFSQDLGTAEVAINIVHAGVGAVTETDVDLAVTSESIIIAFNVVANERARRKADETGVDVRSYRVIYEAQQEVRAALEGMLAPKKREVVQGHAEVRNVFASSALGKIAGCYQTDGETKRGALARLIRDGVIKYEGKIASLRRHKDDVRSIATGYECGIKLENYEDIQEGDVIETFEIEEIARTLESGAL
ncbi:MAG: translation initiation factor IF-2 [Candidatus Hydrogenedens sp.]|jgi:translation initiation factor IF-2|nr:translation initiation factor IF-2 [Candidatus Hydrogenedens sp.]